MGGLNWIEERGKVRKGNRHKSSLSWACRWERRFQGSGQPQLRRKGCRGRERWSGEAREPPCPKRRQEKPSPLGVVAAPMSWSPGSTSSEASSRLVTNQFFLNQSINYVFVLLQIHTQKESEREKKNGDRKFSPFFSQLGLNLRFSHCNATLLTQTTSSFKPQKKKKHQRQNDASSVLPLHLLSSPLVSFYLFAEPNPTKCQPSLPPRSHDEV